MKMLLSTLLVFLVFYSITFAFSGEVIKFFNTPGSYPTGLCYDGKNLWLADRGTDKIYYLNPETGTLIRQIESPAYWPMGLAWDGKYLWNADYRGRTDKSEDLDGMIFKIDPPDLEPIEILPENSINKEINKRLLELLNDATQSKPENRKYGYK